MLNTLIDELQRELDDPRLVALRGDGTELGAPKGSVRGAELRSVRQVEKLRSKLKAELFLQCHVLDQRNIQILAAVEAAAAESAGGVAERIRRCRRKYARVKPAVGRRIIEFAAHTAPVGPLAAALGLPVNHAYAEEEETALAAAVASAPSPVLIVWHHGAIPRLVKEIAGKLPACPGHWPDDRFDLIWILEHNAAHAGGWSFSQVTQRLLPGDCTDGPAP